MNMFLLLDIVVFDLQILRNVLVFFNEQCIYLTHVYIYIYTNLWTPLHGRATFGRLIGTYRQQLCRDSGRSLEDLLGVMNDRDEWGERERERERESQRKACKQRDLMMYIYIYIYIYIR